MSFSNRLAKVSKIGIGGNIFSHFLNFKDTSEIINCAAENGINLIDTSSSYSDGDSEKFIGECICKNRDYWIIASKCGNKSGVNPAGIGSKKNISKKLDESLVRLNLDYIDIYQMHHFDPATPLEETILCLNNLIEVGKIKSYGVSNFNSQQLKDFCEIASSLNLELPITNQYKFNIFSKNNFNNILSVNKKYNIMSIYYGVLARGLLGGSYANSTNIPASSRANVSASVKNDLSPKFFESLDSLKKIASQMSLSLSQLALAWIFNKDFNSISIVGFRKKSHVVDLIKSVDIKIPSDIMLLLENISNEFNLD